MPTRRVFVSVTSQRNLDTRRRSLRDALIARITAAGYQVEAFWQSGMAQRMAWNFDNVDRVIRECVGAVVVGFPRFMSASSPAVPMVGEYNHYEGAVAMTHRLPLLLLAERGVADRGVVWTGGGRPICFMPDDATLAWLDDPAFSRDFEAWRQEVGRRRDVFLGYCSENIGIAAQVENVLVRSGATVLNYAMDFGVGTSILEEIENARKSCSAGIFIFGENDPLEGTAAQAAPRDNVVFEAGYFMAARGPDRSLIIRVGNAKMPADLGGAIYLSLAGHDVSPIEAKLRRFVDAI